MFPLILAAALAGQYPSPQAPQYGAPMQYAAPPQTYSVPIQYGAPQVVTLGAGQVMPPSMFGVFLGHVGRKLEAHSWPRVQPMMAAPATMQTVYLQVAAPQAQVMQAVYSVPAPQYQAPPTYGAPAPPQKNPPTQYQAPPTYGSPQAPQGGGGMYGAPNPSRPNPAGEAAPPVPKA